MNSTTWAPKKVAFWFREMGPRLFQGNLGWWNFVPFGQEGCKSILVFPWRISIENFDWLIFADLYLLFTSSMDPSKLPSIEDKSMLFRILLMMSCIEGPESNEQGDNIWARYASKNTIYVGYGPLPVTVESEGQQESPTKHVIILVVTVTRRGPYQRYTLHSAEVHVGLENWRSKFHQVSLLGTKLLMGRHLDRCGYFKHKNKVSPLRRYANKWFQWILFGYPLWKPLADMDGVGSAISAGGWTNPS